MLSAGSQPVEQKSTQVLSQLPILLQCAFDCRMRSEYDAAIKFIERCIAIFKEEGKVRQRRYLKYISDELKVQKESASIRCPDFFFPHQEKSFVIDQFNYIASCIMYQFVLGQVDRDRFKKALVDFFREEDQLITSLGFVEQGANEIDNKEFSKAVDLLNKALPVLQRYPYSLIYFLLAKSYCALNKPEEMLDNVKKSSAILASLDESNVHEARKLFYS